MNFSAILAQEMTKPKSVSLRTMDVVRNLSMNDAKVFQKLIKGQIEGCIPKGEDGNVQYASFDEVLQMQEAGLLQNSDFAQMTFTRTYTKSDGSKGQVLFIESSDCVVCADNGLEIPCYPLTKAGVELSRLALVAREESDVVEIAKFIDKSIGGKKHVSVHRKIQASGRKTVAWDGKAVWAASSQA